MLHIIWKLCVKPKEIKAVRKINFLYILEVVKQFHFILCMSISLSIYVRMKILVQIE